MSRGPVELLELADGVGDGEQSPGFAGTVEILSAKGPAGRPGGGGDGFARASVGRDVDRPGLRACWPRVGGGAAGSKSGPASAVPGRLEASASTPATGAAEAGVRNERPADLRARARG